MWRAVRVWSNAVEQVPQVVQKQRKAGCPQVHAWGLTTLGRDVSGLLPILGKHGQVMAASQQDRTRQDRRRQDRRNRTGGNRTGGNSTGGNRTGGNRTGGNRTGGNRTGGNRTGQDRREQDRR